MKTGQRLTKVDWISSWRKVELVKSALLIGATSCIGMLGPRGLLSRRKLQFSQSLAAKVDVDITIGPVLNVFSHAEKDIGGCKVWVMVCKLLGSDCSSVQKLSQTSIDEASTVHEFHGISRLLGYFPSKIAPQTSTSTVLPGVSDIDRMLGPARGEMRRRCDLFGPGPGPILYEMVLQGLDV